MKITQLLFIAGVLFSSIGSILQAASLTVAWDPVPGATGYIVERALGSGTALTFSEINRPTTTSYVDTALADATTYSYRVKAFNSFAISPYSNVASGTTAAALPAPGNIKVAPTPAVAILMLKPNQRVLMANTDSAVRANPNDPVHKMAPNETVQVYAVNN